MWYGISVNGLGISFGNFMAETPWDVMNVDTGEIRMFDTYKKAYDQESQRIPWHRPTGHYKPKWDARVP